MIVLPLLGCAIGAAVFYLVILIRPPAVDPLVQLARFDEARNTATQRGHSPSAPRGGAETRVGRWVSEELARRGIAYTRLRQDLALNGQTFESTMGRKVLFGVGGFLLGLVITIFMTVAGAPLPFGSPAVVALLLGTALFFVPDFDARTAADKRRREFRRALGAYLDWVSLQMSGLASAEQALPDAARIGASWPLALIRHTVATASHSGTDVWAALTDLGERIGVTQLRELGTLVQLVARNGALVRETLSARAASLREQELADADGDAGRRDQSMLMAQILLGLGFAVFLGYPAVVNFLRT